MSPASSVKYLAGLKSKFSDAANPIATVTSCTITQISQMEKIEGYTHTVLPGATDSKKTSQIFSNSLLKKDRIL